MNAIWPFLFYFFFYAAGSALYPYFALYYRSLGLTGAEVGLITGLAPLITLVGAPFWAGLADTTRRHKAVLSLTLAGLIGCTLAIPLANGFLWLLLMVLAYSFVSAPIVALADSATLSMLAERREQYGRVRLGGTIGWGVMAMIAGAVIGRYGLVSSFWMYAIGIGLTLIVAQGMFFARVEKQASVWNGLGLVLGDARWRLFLALVFLGGMGMAAINSYQVIYLDELGASKTLIGISLAAATLSELPVMFYGDRLLKRFTARGLLVMGVLVVGLRCVLYAAFNFPLAILALQLLNGLTFPALWIAGVAYAHDHAPPGLSATAQGLFGATLMGVGAGAGGFLGGWLIDDLGGRGLFLVFGAVVLVGTTLLLLIERWRWAGQNSENSEFFD